MSLPLRATFVAGVLLSTALILAIPATSQTSAPAAPVAHQTWTIDKAPQDLQPAVSRAELGIRMLMTGVQNRLMEVLATKGPVAAMDVYRRDMYFLQVEAAERQGVTIGQTSQRLRNPANAPRPWAAAIVKETADKKFRDVPTYVVDLGDKVGVLHPIAVGDTCAMCHGPAAFRPADVDAVVKAAYPHDQAINYKNGDLRGFYWAEAPKTESTQ